MQRDKIECEWKLYQNFFVRDDRAARNVTIRIFHMYIYM